MRDYQVKGFLIYQAIYINVSKKAAKIRRKCGSIHITRALDYLNKNNT